MEWSGVEWSGVEWSVVEWSGVEWSGVEWSGVEWSACIYTFLSPNPALIIQTKLCIQLSESLLRDGALIMM